MQNKIVFISNKAVNNYINTNVGKFLNVKKIHVLHNPLDIPAEINPEQIEKKYRNSIRKLKNIFSNIQNTSNEDNKFRIVIVSRLVEGKGIIEILKRIKNIFDCQLIELEIYGDGPLFNEIKRYINDNLKGGNVLLMGYSKKIDDVYLKSDMLIFPSTNEGFGRVPFEAFLKGNLILCNEHVSIINEMIEVPSSWRTYGETLDISNELRTFSMIDASECSREVNRVGQLLSSNLHVLNFKKILESN